MYKNMSNNTKLKTEQKKQNRKWTQDLEKFLISEKILNCSWCHQFQRLWFDLSAEVKNILRLKYFWIFVARRSEGWAVHFLQDICKMACWGSSLLVQKIIYDSYRFFIILELNDIFVNYIMVTLDELLEWWF